MILLLNLLGYCIDSDLRSLFKKGSHFLKILLLCRNKTSGGSTPSETTQGVPGWSHGGKDWGHEGKNGQDRVGRSRTGSFE